MSINIHRWLDGFAENGSAVSLIDAAVVLIAEVVSGQPGDGLMNDDDVGQTCINCWWMGWRQRHFLIGAELSCSFLGHLLGDYLILSVTQSWLNLSLSILGMHFSGVLNKFFLPRMSVALTDAMEGKWEIVTAGDPCFKHLNLSDYNNNFMASSLKLFHHCTHSLWFAIECELVNKIIPPVWNEMWLM